MQDINNSSSIVAMGERESYYDSCISITDSVLDINASIILPDQPYVDVVIDILPEPTQPQRVLPIEQHLPASLEASNSSNTQISLQIIVILTSKNEIKEARVRYISNPSKDKSIFQKSRAVYQTTNIIIFMIKATVAELTDLTLEYYEKQPRMFLFSKKTLREHPLSSVMIHGEAGLHFNELTQNNTNLLLQNYCILTAHDHLVVNLRFFKKLQIIPQFYHIFRGCFKTSLEENTHIFHQYSPLNNIFTSEFFIYFFFTLYKDRGCEKLIQKYDIPLKIGLKKVSVLLKYKFYSIFEPSNDYKNFLFYVYFYAALTQKQVEEASLREIAQWNVLNQDDERVQIMLSLLQKNESCFFYLFGKNAINNRILTNPRISLQVYISYKLAFCERILETISEEDVSELLSRFFDHITVKAAKMQGQLLADLSIYTAKVVSLFVRNNRLIEGINAGELYNKLKAKAKHSSQIGMFFFTALKAYIFPLIPQLLVDNYECTIIPLVIKPQVAEENNILLHHFQDQRIDEHQILFILRIWQEMNSEEYNINIIEFVILKFVAFNPYFDMPLLQKIIQAFNQQLKDVSVTQHCKSLIPAFCLKIANEMKDQQMKARFAEWASTIQPKPL